MTPTRTARAAGVTVADHGERGSISVLAILIAATVVVMMGLAVDVSGHVHAMQEARSVAREAARAGAQQVNVPTAIRGHGVQTSPGEAAAAANTHLAAAGTTGSAAVTGPTTIAVTVTSTYHTRFLGVVGISTLSSTGQADARITRAQDGIEQ